MADYTHKSDQIEIDPANNEPVNTSGNYIFSSFPVMKNPKQKVEHLLVLYDFH